MTVTPEELKKLVGDIKFLQDVDYFAKRSMHTSVPYDRPDLYVAKCFVQGFLDTLAGRGLEIRKKT